MAPIPYYERKQVQRKKVFTSHWMTSEKNFATVKKIEQETARKDKIKQEKEKVANEAVAKVKKEKATKKRKARKHVIKRIKANPKL